MAKASVAAMCALIGQDPFLQLQALEEIESRLADGVQRFDLDGAKAELADVLDEVRSVAMFGSGKLVVVRDADEFVSRYREPLERYAQAAPPDGVLVLRLSSLPSNQRIYKAIDKLGGIQKCDPPRDLPKWIVSHGAKAHKVVVELDAAKLLADLIGSSMGRLDTELAKLAIGAEGGRITSGDVAGGVTFGREQELKEMTGLLSARKASEAVRKWRQIMGTDPTAEFRAVTWLTIWLENVRKAQPLFRRGLSPDAICQQLRIFPFEARAGFIKTAKAMGPAGVAEALTLLAETDRRSKSGLGDFAENVERFLLTMSDRMA